MFLCLSKAGATLKIGNLHLSDLTLSLLLGSADVIFLIVRLDEIYCSTQHWLTQQYRLIWLCHLIQLYCLNWLYRLYRLFRPMRLSHSVQLGHLIHLCPLIRMT